MSTSMQSLAELSYEGREVLCNSIALVLQSLFYGIHIVVIPFAAHILLKQGRSKSNVTLFCIMLVPFALSTGYWAVEFAELLVKIEVFFMNPAERNGRNITYYSTMWNAIALLNYVISDAIVVWRAWALCRQDYKRLLLIPFTLLTLVSLSVFTTIVLRFASFFTSAGPGATKSHPLIRAIDVLQVSNLVWSLLTNIAATSIVTHKAWRHRLMIKASLQDTRNKTTRAERILALLIESGFLYCTSGATILISTIIKLPYGTLGDIYTPVNLQIAGIYPAIVIVLVGLQRTMNDTTYWQSTEPTVKASRSAASAVASQIQFTRDPAVYKTASMSTSLEDLDMKGELMSA